MALRESALFSREVIAEIQRAAREGVYDIRGFGAKRRLPHFDDLLLLGASVSRYPLEGYRERCDTNVVLGTRHAKRPLELDIPITIAGHELRRALGAGQGGAGPRRERDGHLDDDRRRRHDARGARRVQDARLPAAALALRDEPRRPAPRGRDRDRHRPGRQARRRRASCSARRSPIAWRRCATCRRASTSAARAVTPTGRGPTTSQIKIEELREITDWEKPIFIKIGASRTYFDVALAVKAGADVIVLDGMQGGTAATQDVFIEHVGIPTLPAVRLAVDALQELGMHRRIQLVVSGGIRSGADVAKALALGADAVSIGVAALIALGDNSPAFASEYERIGTAPGFYDDWQEGRDPVGISTQDDELAARFDPELGGRRLANYLRTMVLETQTLARACGKSHVQNLEPEDLVALTVEAAAMARVPLAGTNWIPGTPDG